MFCRTPGLGVLFAQATSLAFLDLDLVQGEIGGLVSIGRAVDETAITSLAAKSWWAPLFDDRLDPMGFKAKEINEGLSRP